MAYHKYHQTRKDREDERRGMKGHDRSHGSLKTEGMDEGYMGMISEDHDAPANLPQEPKMEYYPKSSYMDDYYLDDTIRGVDENLENSKRKIDEYPSDSMY